MKVRENARLKRGSAEYEVVKRNVLDLYIITENATASYEIFRRAVDGEEYRDTMKRGTAAAFFKREEHVAYMDNRRTELAYWGFELHAKKNNLDITEFKVKEDKYSDIENITPDEIRTKNMSQLEEIIRSTDNETNRLAAIKQQTELMDAKMKKEQVQSTDEYIHFYLPTPYCKDCLHKPQLKNKEDGKE